MAEDIHSEGSEEEKKDSAGSQDDDDFGLPDLEFEELEELDLDLDDDEPEEEASADELDINLGSPPAEPEAPIAESDGSALEEGIDEVEDVLDSAQLISDRLGDTEEETSDPASASDINYDDLLGESSSSDSGESAPADEDMSELESIDINSEDTISSESDDSLANIDSPDELAALGIDEEEETSTESLFAADPDVSSESADSDIFGGEDDDFEGGSIFASDDVALESTESKEEFEAPAEEDALPPTYKPYADEETKGGFAKVIIFGALGFAIVGFIFYFFFMQSGGAAGEKHVAKKTTEVKKTTPTKTKKETASKEADDSKEVAKSSDKPEPKKASGNKTTGTSEAKAKTPAPKKKAPAKKVSKPKPKPASTAPAGEIVNIQAKTGRSYVIIGSFIDEDLANDFAKELSTSGSGVKVIFPYGNSKRYRVSIADFGSYSDATAQIGGYKASYGEDIWTLKY
ncbi:MAG: SPOR domain-containing protein [Cyclobacteriaceae bacterium]